MTNINVVGRIAQPVQIFQGAPGKKSVALITVAIPRTYADKDGNYGADFVQFKEFMTNGQVARAQKLYRKGALVQIDADFRTSTYIDADGTRQFKEDKIVNNVNATLAKAVNGEAPILHPFKPMAEVSAPAMPDFGAPVDPVAPQGFEEPVQMPEWAQTDPFAQ